MDWMLMPFRRYAEFSGRSRRMEFWMFQLLGLIVGAVIYALMLAGGGMDILMSATATGYDPSTGAELEQASFGPMFWIGCILAVVWVLAAFIPSLAVTVRRLHDRNMSGWYLVAFIVAVIVLSMIPVLGQIVVLVLEIGYIVLMALPGTRGPNNYGPDPLGQVDSAVFS